ncbi:MAG: GAF domain-containing protein, partial [Burkholderiaceae bacterium]
AAAALFESLGDTAQQGRALLVQALAHWRRSRAEEADQAAARALALAQASGDLQGQANALNVLTYHQVDLAARLKRLHQALALHRAGGSVLGQNAILNNLGNVYRELGLHRHARRLYAQVAHISRRTGAEGALRTVAWNLARIETDAEHIAAARVHAQEIWALMTRAGQDAVAKSYRSYLEGTLALREGRAAQAVRDFDRAVRECDAANTQGRMMFLTALATAHLAAGRPAAALAASRRGLRLQAKVGSSQSDEFDAKALWWRHSQALRASGREAQAIEALQRAYGLVLDSVRSLGDEGLRRNVLNKHAVTREIVTAWLAHARQRRLPREQREAHLAGAANLGEPFERLVDTGLRLNEIKAASDLQEFLIDEATELSGAERVLLVFEGADGPKLAGSTLPPGESADALLQVITPWLDEARISRSACLRHGPEGAEPVQQRSCLVAPLVAQRELLGFLYCDIEGAFGRFQDSDRDLLAMLAAQAAVALANVRASEGLERTVAERTAQLAQRAGELALINSIQQGIASKLDFQGIVDLVGDKLREVFGSEDLSIRWWDVEADTIVSIYTVEHGQHMPKLAARKVQATNKPALQILHEGVGAYFGSHAEQVAAGIGSAVPGTDWCLSIIGAPIRGTQRVLGMIVIENHEREQAYGEPDLRVLTTIGATMGTALENARLFDETQRRNAELAVINSIQQGIAGELGFQAIVELVGGKLCEVLHTRDISIRWWDEEADVTHPVYVIEHGVRLYLKSQTPPAGGITERILRRRESFVAGTEAERMALGIGVYAGTDSSKSWMAVPIVGSSRVLGRIQVEDHEREYAFGPADLRLLQTVSASMGVALENARLFDEIQRNARESSALSDVGRDLSSTLDLATVMDRIAAHAKALLTAQNSAIFLPDAEGRTYRALVALGDLAETLKATAVEPGRGIIGSLIESGRPEFINDSAADARALPIPGTPLQHDERLMVVPLKSGDEVQGAMAVWRSGGQPFEARELAFLEGLSQQAVIALNNARLFDQTQAALQRQTASADILRVISQSPNDVMPVAEVIVSTARRLLGCYRTSFLRREGEVLVSMRHATAGGVAPGMVDRIPLDSAHNFPARALVSRVLLHIPDWSATELPAHEQTIHRLTGCRSSLMLPLLRGQEGLGVLIFQRDKPEPFSDADIALAQSFADQAVIAIENVRLFNETKEALERQTATAEVLQVISGSMADATPVFEKVLDSCEQLFGAQNLGIFLAEGDQLTAPVHRGEFAWTVGQHYPRPLAGTMSQRAMASGEPLHLPRVSEQPDLPAYLRDIQNEQGDFSILITPLVWQGKSLGTLDIARKPPRPFSDKEVSLLKTFADQAVVAIQNARLFNETKEALERQTATSEILRVISESPGNVQPVLDAVAERARLLCKADGGRVWLLEAGQLRGMTGYGPGYDDTRDEPLPVRRTSVAGRAVLDSKAIHLADVVPLIDSEFPDVRAMQQKYQQRAMLAMPLLRDGQALGVISLLRKEAREFTPSEVKLLETFADQSVIAIENVRLFNETKEALLRQTATTDVLKVISSSPTDVQPVFDVIAERAARLTGAKYGWVLRYDGEWIHVASSFGVDAQGIEASRRAFPMRPGSGSAAARSVRDGSVVNLADVLAEEDADYAVKSIASVAGFRSVLSVPMLREGQSVGVITAARAEAGRFPDKEVDLLQTFASQAVIAIENVRLFHETQEALARQTATSDVLEVISESPTDVQPVFDIIAERAASLTAARFCLVTRMEGEIVHLVSLYGVNEAGSAALRAAWPQRLPDSTSIAAHAMRERRVINVADLLALSDAEYAP